MKILWAIVALFTLSVVAARWQFSTTRTFVQYIWYQHWRMRERQRELDFKLFQRFPRIWVLRSRLRRPFNTERMWRFRSWLGTLWFKYASFFAPKCPKHKQWPLMGGHCYGCTMDRMQQRHRLNNLTGKGSV
jgi:hypothetical protein